MRNDPISEIVAFCDIICIRSDHSTKAAARSTKYMNLHSRRHEWVVVVEFKNKKNSVSNKLKFKRNKNAMNQRSILFSCLCIHNGVRTVWIHCREENKEKACYSRISQFIQMDDAASSDSLWSMKSKNGVRRRWMQVYLSFNFFSARQGQGSRPKWIQITPNRMELIQFFFSCRTAYWHHLYALDGTMWEFILLITSSPFTLLLYIGHWNCLFYFSAVSTSKHCIQMATAAWCHTHKMW